MLSVIIPNTDEPTVIQLTFDNLRKELASIDGSELLVEPSWRHGIEKAKGDFICLVEPDCLVSGGYFSSNLGLFKKRAHYRKLAMVASCLGVDNWGNRIYNYTIDEVESEPSLIKGSQITQKLRRIAPERKKKGNGLYPVQVGFLPGAIFRKSVLQDLVTKIDIRKPDLVALSTDVSFHLWSTGRRIEANPNTTYVTTDRSVENPSQWEPKVPSTAANIFVQEQI